MASTLLADGDGQAHDGLPSPSLSARVRLEVAILDADANLPALERPAADEHVQHTVLVVAAEPDLRRYIRECLRERRNVRIVEAKDVASSVGLTERASPRLLIVDESAARLLDAMPAVPAILIVDERAERADAGTCVRVLAQPFSAEGLLAEVDRQLE